MMPGVLGLQSQKIGSWASGGGGTFAIPDDSGIVVVSGPDGELHYAMLSSNHVVMCYSSHELKITVCDCSLGVSESD